MKSIPGLIARHVKIEIPDCASTVISRYLSSYVSFLSLLASFAFICRMKKLKDQDNHGMIYTAELKVVLHMMSLKILSNAGGKL